MCIGCWWALDGLGVLPGATLTLVDRACLVAVTHEKPPFPSCTRTWPECACNGCRGIAACKTHRDTHCAGGWQLEPRSPELTRPAEAAAAAAAEKSAPLAHLFAYPLESNFSGARCAPGLALTLSVNSLTFRWSSTRRCIGNAVPGFGTISTVSEYVMTVRTQSCYAG